MRSKVGFLSNPQKNSSLKVSVTNGSVCHTWTRGLLPPNRSTSPIAMANRSLPPLETKVAIKGLNHWPVLSVRDGRTSKAVPSGSQTCSSGLLLCSTAFISIGLPYAIRPTNQSAGRLLRQKALQTGGFLSRVSTPSRAVSGRDWYIASTCIG